MNRDDLKKIFPILQAFADGKMIEEKIGDSWKIVDEIVLDSKNEYNIDTKMTYRVVTKMGYRELGVKDASEILGKMISSRSFGDFKKGKNCECLDDVGWKLFKKRYIIEGITNKEVFVHEEKNSRRKKKIKTKDVLKYYTFVDGFPCGMSVEVYKSM